MARSEIRRICRLVVGADRRGAVSDGRRLLYEPCCRWRACPSHGGLGGGSAHRIGQSVAGALFSRGARARLANRAGLDVSNRDFQRRFESTRGDQRGDGRLPSARSSAHRRRAVRSVARYGASSRGGRSLARRSHHRGSQFEARQRGADRRGAASHHRGAGLSAGSRHELRQSRARGADELAGCQRNPIDPTGQPSHLRWPVRRAVGFDRSLSRLSAGAHGRRRATARSRRHQPRAEFRGRAGEPVFESGELGVGVARRRRRGDGRAALCEPPHRGRRTDEMHGRGARIRAVDIDMRVEPVGDLGGRRGYAVRILGSIRYRVAAARFNSRSAAGRVLDARAGRARHGHGHADRLRVAAAAAVETHAAVARAAKDGRSAHASLRIRLRARLDRRWPPYCGLWCGTRSSC